MPGRAEFLEAIRHRTQAGRYKPTNAPDVAWTPDGAARERSRSKTLRPGLSRSSKPLGGHGKRVGSLEEAREYVSDLAREREAKLLVRWNVDELESSAWTGLCARQASRSLVWRDLPDLREVAGGRTSGSRQPRGP